MVRCRRVGRASITGSFSSRLTKVAAYRQTLCGIGAEDYLLRKINAVPEPIVEKAEQARATMQEIASEMIANLHWSDFETLVDLMFARTGWHRISRIGGTMKDADLILEQMATGEKALVQVKSRADQHVLNDYVHRFEDSGQHEWLFFVCHSTKGELAIPQSSSVRVWERQELARIAIASGLFDWLLDKSG